MDVVKVRDVTAEALEKIRSEEGPVFIEAMTYRFRGHSVADPSNYRESSEVDEWQKKDPIELFRKISIDNGLLNESDIEQIGQKVDSIVEQAIQFAEESDDPSPESLYANIYK